MALCICSEALLVFKTVAAVLLLVPYILHCNALSRVGKEATHGLSDIQYVAFVPLPTGKTQPQIWQYYLNWGGFENPQLVERSPTFFKRQGKGESSSAITRIIPMQENGGDFKGPTCLHTRLPPRPGPLTSLVPKEVFPQTVFSLNFWTGRRFRTMPLSSNTWLMYGACCLVLCKSNTSNF